LDTILNKYNKWALYGLAIALLFGCQKAKNLHDVKIFTHAVTGLYNPGTYFNPNTVNGLNYALSFEGLEGFEMDVQFSSDSSLWMFHDSALEDNTTGQGQVCERNDIYLSSLVFLRNETPLSRLKDISIQAIQGEKDIYLDLKYFSNCSVELPSAQRLLDECAVLLNHPQLNVSFISNDISLATDLYNLGYSVWANGLNFESLDLSNEVYSGWFIRNAEISNAEIAKVKASNKRVILYDAFSSLSVKAAINKAPYALLVEDVIDAVVLSRE
jgi:glycerophosphoryl diester phosphodiesterase